MITFAYDETTGFEITKAEPAFLAGVIYDSKNEKEYKEISCERARIEAYYRAVFAECGGACRFPRDLHITDDKKNSKSVSKIKEKINKSLVEFFTKGTYKGKELLFLNKDREIVTDQESSVKPIPRKGRYQLIAIQKGDDEDISGDLEVYRNMVKSIIEKAIYTNQAIDDDQIVQINAPTRTLSDKKDDNELTEEVRKQFKHHGYRFERKNNLWFIVDAGFIGKTVEEYDNTYRKFDPERTIRRIKDGYELKVEDHSGAQEFAFLFLADTLCSFLKDNLYGMVQKQSLKEIYKSLQEINTEELEKADRDIIKRNISRVEDCQRYRSWMSQFVSSNQLKSDEVKELFKELKKKGSIIFFVGLTLPRYRFSKPSASLDMNLRQCVG